MTTDQHECDDSHEPEWKSAADKECAHCGRSGQSFGRFNGSPLCHTDEPERDCYRLVTVYWEPLGSRRTTIPADHLGDWLADDYLRGNRA